MGVRIRASMSHLRMVAILAFATSLLQVTPTLALTCAREWGGDTLAGARDAVAGRAAGWADGLLLGTIVSVEHRNDDPGRIAAVTVEPEVSFSGPFRTQARFEIGGHGPLSDFTAGSRWFLVLHHSEDPNGWFLDPCGPTMKVTSEGELQALRAATDGEVVIREPTLSAGLQPPPWPIFIGFVAIGVTAWIFRRAERRPPSI